MRVTNKKTLLWSTAVTTVVSVLSGIILSPAVGVIIGILLSVIYLVVTNIDFILELKSDFIEKLAGIDAELLRIETRLAKKPDLPLESKYLQIQERNCPVFRRAASRIYKNAIAELDTLSGYQIVITDLEEVFYWLDYLFCHLLTVKSIKAVSFGEFKEWQDLDDWWMQNYLRLHRTAHERGADIERIFIVKSHHSAATADDVFKTNVKHHVNVKIGLQGSIQRADMQNSNCLLFFNEEKEPMYALVAKHNHKGDFESAIIYGDTETVRLVATSYHRIEGISEDYRPSCGEQLAPRKTA
jgi:MFS superfamily sulfate permease-like transporter